MSQPAQSSDEQLWMNVETFRSARESEGDVILLDVRGARAWDVGSVAIPGALRAYPELRIDPRWPKDRLILAVCSDSGEATSVLVARHLRERGFRAAYALIGGVEAWRSAGFPVEPKASLILQGTRR
jgi:rhodanese-related sulfurtransferase